MVELGHTDDWGSGSTEETNYRSEQDDGHGAAAGAGAATDWDDGEWDDVEFLSSFGFAGESGDGHGSDAIATWGDGAGEGTAASPLSERDAARLEEVGMMVRELEDGGGDGGAASMATGAGGGGAGAGTTSATPQPRSSREGDGGAVDRGHTDAERRAEFVGGVATGNAHLRMTCGDPVFFDQLADLMHGLHRQSRGRKFLTHAEEMALGGKVQRYRRLIEVRNEDCSFVFFLVLGT